VASRDRETEVYAIDGKYCGGGAGVPEVRRRREALTPKSSVTQISLF
jgi:hypothetical protein